MARVRTFALVSALVGLTLSSSAFAQSKSALRKDAASAAAQMRAAGEPKDRCWLGAIFTDGAIVTRTFADGALKGGDRLLAIDDKSVAGWGGAQLLTLLRTMPPGGKVAAKINRGGAEQVIDVTCANSKPAYVEILAGLDQAAKGKFEECVATFSRIPNSAAFEMMMRSECATYSKNADPGTVGGYVYDALRSMIEEATFDSSAQQNTASTLVRMRTVIERGPGSASYGKLVELTKAWPGGDKMIAAAVPDYRELRRRSEAAIKSRLIDPMSAAVEWPNGFTYGTWKPMLSKRIEGYWTCGRVNAKNRMGGYTGDTPFEVVLNQQGDILYNELGSGDPYGFLTIACNNSAGHLPPPQPELTGGLDAPSPSAGNSIADQLAKLAQLKAEGALTDAEFETAKKRLLEAPQ